MKDLWKRFRGDFNTMDDGEIDQEVEHAQSVIDEQVTWCEAVSSWKAAGKPRDPR